MGRDGGTARGQDPRGGQGLGAWSLGGSTRAPKKRRHKVSRADGSSRVDLGRSPHRHHTGWSRSAVRRMTYTGAHRHQHEAAAVCPQKQAHTLVPAVATSTHAYTQLQLFIPTCTQWLVQPIIWSRARSCMLDSSGPGSQCLLGPG